MFGIGNDEVKLVLICVAACWVCWFKEELRTAHVSSRALASLVILLIGLLFGMLLELFRPGFV